MISLGVKQAKEHKYLDIFSSSISDDGKHIYFCCSNCIYCSHANGYSLEKVFPAKSDDEGICSVCCDLSGKYVTTNTKTKLYISDTYGNSFDYSKSFGTFIENIDPTLELTVGVCLEDVFINKTGQSV